MIAVPFIYFSFLSYLFYRRRRLIDMGMIIAFVYGMSGLFSILIDVFSLRARDSIYYTISAEATFAYCGLLTMCLLPIALNSHTAFRRLKPVSNPQILKLLAWFAVVWFIFTAILSWQNMMNVLTGDMEEYRRQMYADEGQESWMLVLPPPIRIVVAIVNSIFGCNWALIFLAFFSRFVQRLHPRFFFMFLLASLSGPMNGIIGANRSATAYWIMSLFGLYLLFRPYMPKQEKRRFVLIAGTIVVLLITYLAAMTLARFGDREYGGDVSGTQGGLISYLGQSFINFCCYFDTYEPPFYHLGIIFPFTFQYVLGIPSGGVIIQEQMTELTGFETGVFYTYIGQIIVGAGKVVAIAFCIVYSVYSSIILPRIVRSQYVSISSLYLYYALASVMFLGIFGHYYTSGTSTFGLIMMYLILRIIK